MRKNFLNYSKLSIVIFIFLFCFGCQTSRKNLSDISNISDNTKSQVTIEGLEGQTTRTHIQNIDDNFDELYALTDTTNSGFVGMSGSVITSGTIADDRIASTIARDTEITYESLNSNGDVGTGSSQVAAGDHTHSGVYEPADATILKDADIGSTVESATSNDFDPDRLAGDTTDDDLISGSIIDTSTLTGVNAETLTPSKTSGVAGYSYWYEADTTNTLKRGFQGADDLSVNISDKLPNNAGSVGQIPVISNVQTSQTLPNGDTGTIVTYTNTTVVPTDDGYSSGWNGDITEIPSKDDIYDKIESLSVSASIPTIQASDPTIADTTGYYIATNDYHYFWNEYGILTVDLTAGSLDDSDTTDPVNADGGTDSTHDGTTSITLDIDVTEQYISTVTYSSTELSLTDVAMSQYGTAPNYTYTASVDPNGSTSTIDLVVTSTDLTGNTDQDTYNVTYSGGAVACDGVSVFCVDTDVSGGTGDGSSWANAYSGIQAALTAEVADITGVSGGYTFICRNSAGTADTEFSIAAEYTTDADSPITIQADSSYAANGQWDTAKYIVERTSGTTANGVVTINNSNVVLDGLQIYANTTSVSIFGVVINSTGAFTGNTIKNCIIREAATGGGSANGITSTYSGSYLNIYNCILWDWQQHAIYDGSGSGGYINVWNSTITESGTGINLISATTRLVAKNNAVFNNTNDFNNCGSATLDYNASDDGDGTNAVALNENASGEWTASFTDYAAGDFSVKDASAPIYNVCNGDPSSGVYSDDITGFTRTGNWDMGAFELQ